MTVSPLVAVSTTTRIIEGLERVRLNQSYIHALEGAGLIPLVLPPLSDAAKHEPVLEAVHGLVLTGGEDLDPAYYGADRHPLAHEPHPRRDTFELGLVHAARRAGLPTLAICRGVQVTNVALGGTLIQDIPSLLPNAGRHEGDEPRDSRVHRVRITAESRLAEALGARDISVNSSHHQALDRVADGLRVTALAPDGVIEGVEWVGDEWWMLGVQWHPEELVDSQEPWDRQLFAAFASAVRLHLAAGIAG